jgi:hypothetical protein
MLKIVSKLKEQDLIHCVWTVKNLPQDIFKHVFCGEDQYMKKKTEVGNLQVDEDVQGQ